MNTKLTESQADCLKFLRTKLDSDIADLERSFGVTDSLPYTMPLVRVWNTIDRRLREDAVRVEPGTEVTYLD